MPFSPLVVTVLSLTRMCPVSVLYSLVTTSLSPYLCARPRPVRAGVLAVRVGMALLCFTLLCVDVSLRRTCKSLGGLLYSDGPVVELYLLI